MKEAKFNLTQIRAAMDELMFYFLCIWVVGGLISFGTWWLTRRWPTFLGLLVRSFVIALTVTPGLVVGHGVAILPVSLVFYAVAFQWSSDTGRAAAILIAILPLMAVWGWLLLFFSLVFHSTKKKPGVP